MRSCQRPRKRAASEALPSSVSNRYSLSIRTHGSSCRRRASSSLRRVSSFSTSSSSSRAASHSLRVPVMCFVIALLSFLRTSFIVRSLQFHVQQSGPQIGRDAAGRHPADDVEPHRGQAHWTHRELLSPGSGLAHGAHLAAGATAAVENAGAVGLEAAHDDAGGHLEALEDLARLRIDAAEIAVLALHGAVPELAVHPGDAGDEAIRFDRAQDGAGLGVDLVDLAGAVLADPERPLGPGQARVAAVGGRWDGGDNLARARIDLLDLIIAELP